MPLARRFAPLGLASLLACGPNHADDADGAAPAARRAALREVPAYVPRDLSPKLFSDRGHAYAPLDIDEQALDLDLDVATATARGTARLTFHQKVASRPVFLLTAPVTTLTLDGAPVPFRAHLEDPARLDELYAVEADLAPDEPHTLAVTFTLPGDRVRFSGGGVGLLTSMSDLGPVRYFEPWAPTSFEEDQFPLTLRLVVRGATSPHALFTNGDGGARGEGEWRLRFPASFTTSSFYVHLTNQPFEVRRVTYAGIAREVPLTVYSPSASLADTAIARLPALVGELEAAYGAYPHARFVAFVTDEGGGGMEHCGATITSLRALGHELTHSWFARGVMPAEGRAGWIDEGIATWRDQGYPRAGALLAAAPTNLGDYSPFLRPMPYIVHYDAARLMGEWDLLLAPRGGLRPILRTLFQRYQQKVITSAELRAFLEAEGGVDLDAYFRRYVTGDPPAWPLAPAAPAGAPAATHPLPPTEAALRPLR